jgi:WD40 repeat protein
MLHTLLVVAAVAGGPAEPSVKLVRKFETGDARGRPEAVVSSDGKWLAARAGNGTFSLWDVETGAVKFSLAGRGELSYNPAGFLADGSRLAVTYDVQPRTSLRTECGLATLSVPDCKEVARLPGRRIHALWSGGTTALTTTFAPGRPHDDPNYELWDWKAEKTLTPLDIGPFGGRIAAAAFGPDGKQLAVALDGRREVLRDPAAGRILEVKAWVTPHGRLIDTATGKPGDTIRYPAVSSYRYSAIALSADGKTVFAAGGGHSAERRSPDTLWMWDAATTAAPVSGFFPQFRNGHEVYGIHPLPGGRYLVLGGTFGVLVWDLQKDRAITADPGVKERLGVAATVTFSPTKDGVYVATVTQDGIVAAWKVTMPPAK